MLVKRSKIPFRQIILTGIWPSFIKKMYYRLKGYRIGRRVKIGFGSILSGKDVTIGHDTQIGVFSIIRGRVIELGNYVSIGSFSVIDAEKIHIDDDARINEQVIIGGLKTPESSIRLGKRTIVMEYSFLNPTKPITIGDDTGIGGHCLLFTHGSWLSQLEGYPVSFEPISIGKNVWLPWRVFILPGTTIGDNVVIGANSLVSRTVPSNVLIAGSPAKIIRENYPEPPDPQRRKQMLQDILLDFTHYIEYYGFRTVREMNNDVLEIRISRKSRQWIIQLAENESFSPIKDNSLIIQDFSYDITAVPLSANSMIINIPDKQRKGSSDIGEEMVKFFSRYGIRFERLDG